MMATATLFLVMLIGQSGPLIPLRAASGGDPAGAGAATDVERADSLLRQAAGAYDRGHLDEALKLLQQAYALAPQPAILFNLAQVQRAANDCGAAFTSYRRFLAEVAPDDPNAGRARRRALEMEACVTAQTRPATQAQEGGRPAGVTAEATASTAPRAHPRMRATAWALLSAAVLSAATCAYFAWRAAADSDFSNLRYSPAAYDQRYRDGEQDQRWARLSGAAAVVAGAGGGALIVLSRQDPAPVAGRHPGAGIGLSLLWGWHF